MSGCWCCGNDTTRRNGDPWEGRMEGYCDDCSLARCDAFPGDCPITPSVSEEGAGS